MPRLKLVAGAGFEPVRLTAYETVEPPLLHSRNLKIWRRRRDLNSHQSVYKTDALDSVKLLRLDKYLAADVGFEPTSCGLEDRRSRSAELIG